MWLRASTLNWVPSSRIIMSFQLIDFSRTSWIFTDWFESNQNFIIFKRRRSKNLRDERSYLDEQIGELANHAKSLDPSTLLWNSSYSPKTSMMTLLARGPSTSRKKMFCHVPLINLPSRTGKSAMVLWRRTLSGGPRCHPLYHEAIQLFSGSRAAPFLW